MDARKDIVFLYAHMDDETILSYGTILKYKCLGYNVNVACICGKGRCHCNDESQNLRLNAFKQNLQDIAVDFTLGDLHDLTMTAQNVSCFLRDIIQCMKPAVVFTHSAADLHFEHRLLANELLVACRALSHSTVKELYQTVSPTYDQAFSQFGIFQPNFFVDISRFINEKQKALSRYEVELPADINDIRSAESILAQSRRFGRLMNVSNCEAYQQIFKLA